MTPEPGKLLLRVVTPTGEVVALSCDSVHMQMPDDADGKNGGWIGIRRGHTDAMIALTEGEIQALMDGVLLRIIHVGEGVASVSRDVVTVMCGTAE